MKTAKPLPSRILLVAILLVAACLRFYRLDAQSFWNDEGNSARIAERSINLILEGAAGDIHPPGYYLLLYYWRAMFGHSEFALRSLSAVAGLALVVFTYLLGRRLFGETVGLMAAFLGAISPFAIYYSQEARMYTLLAALSTASTYLIFHFLANVEKPDFTPKTWFLIYIFTSAAGLYVQYAFPFILFVHNAIFILWWLTVARWSSNRWRWLALWAGAQIAIVVLYLPWLLTAIISVTGWSSAGQAYKLGTALLNVLRVLTVGITLPVGEATAALASAGVLLLAGLFTSLWRTDRFNVASAAIYLLLPITLIFGFDLYKSTWLKFLVVVLPPFHLLLALGIKNLAQLTTRILPPASRILMPLASCTLLLASGILLAPSLHNLYLDPAYARDDYRQIAADVAALARPGSAVILNAPNQWEVFTYYYPDQDVYPAPYRPKPRDIDPFLTPLVEQYQKLFVLYWGDTESDPQRLVETQLANRAYKAGDRWYGLVRLAIYGVAPLPEEPVVELDAHFGEAIRLNGYALAGDTFAPGDILPVTLFWQPQAAIAERYKITVQLLDSAGQLVAQHDTEPRDGAEPTTSWEPGQSLTDRYGVPIPPNLAPGHYTLIASLYHIATGERLPVTHDGEPLGNHLSLDTVHIVPPQDGD